MGLRTWVTQDWRANAGRPECQLLLAWFRLAQWARTHWGAVGRLVVTPYWLTATMLIGVELPPDVTIGPRLTIYHPQCIVVSPGCVIGSDCTLRHGVTVGNRIDRARRELGIARLGDHVELGAGCAVIGDLEVGDHARIGALAVVLKSVPAWGVVVGNPGRLVRIDEPASVIELGSAA